MYLKSLTALGFKSFADKTTLNFVPGVAAIVGPNGCGKSNISDAIRWVLGEQSAKALRGGEMADVIFNGTDFRKPLGMGEVLLTIGDVDQEQLRAAGIQIDYKEVTITRRVFRDGGSENFINKKGCPLKEIQNLLRVADTIREVKRQIGSLQRQAGKARRYKQLMSELQHLDTQLARHQYDVLQTEIATKKDTAEKLRVESEVCNDSVARGENEVQQLRER